MTRAGATINEFHGKLLKETFRRGVGDQTAFLLFTLIHLYRIELTGPVLSDRPSVRVIEGITQRGAAEALAALWNGSDDPRADYAHWYRRWNAEWGSYARVENLTPEERKKLRELINRLEQHPSVERIVPDDWDFLPGPSDAEDGQ